MHAWLQLAWRHKCHGRGLSSGHNQKRYLNDVETIVCEAPDWDCAQLMQLAKQLKRNFDVRIVQVGMINIERTTATLYARGMGATGTAQQIPFLRVLFDK